MVLMSVTMKQIYGGYQQNVDSLVIDGIDVDKVRVVGMVRRLVRNDTQMSLNLDDGTGDIDFVYLTNGTSIDNTTVENGKYVKIVGTLLGFRVKNAATAFKIDPVFDYNDITHHFLQCISVHMENINSKLKSGGRTKVIGDPSCSNPMIPNSASSDIIQLDAELSDEVLVEFMESQYGIDAATGGDEIAIDEAAAVVKDIVEFENNDAATGGDEIVIDEAAAVVKDIVESENNALSIEGGSEIIQSSGFGDGAKSPPATSSGLPPHFSLCPPYLTSASSSIALGQSPSKSSSSP